MFSFWIRWLLPYLLPLDAFLCNFPFTKVDYLWSLVARVFSGE